MKENTINAIAKKLSKKHIAKEKDIENIFGQLFKKTIQGILNAELKDHLDSEKSSKTRIKNSRNGYSKKRLKSTYGDIEIITPRDRKSTFEPKVVKKHQTRFQGLDRQIIFLYAKGLSNAQIQDQLREIYDIECSTSFISTVTDTVIEQVEEWQNRPLDKVYPIVYLDCLHVKTKSERQVACKALYLALGVNEEGKKELLGMWMAKEEGAKFWLRILTELKNRGVEDIFIACVDGLKGFPEAIKTAYPKTKVQLCIVHLVRSSLKYVSYKDRKLVVEDLKKVYKAPTKAAAELSLADFQKKWEKKYPYIAPIWERNWENLVTYFDYPEDIRKAIYTTNAIESLNMNLRSVIKNKRVFPSDESVFKVIFLAIQRISKKWTMPIRHWKEAMNRFLIEFGAERVRI